MEVIIIISIVLGIIIGTSFVFDLFYDRIPNMIISIGFLFWFPCIYISRGFSGIISSICSIIIIGTFLFILYLLRGIGAGDVKLMSLIVSFLPLNDGIKLIILIFFIGAFFGVIKLLWVLLYRKSDRNVDFKIISIKFSGPILVGYLFMLLIKGGF